MLAIGGLFIDCGDIRGATPNLARMQDIRASFGLRVRQLRSERGWSQEELADRAELHRTYIGSIERGEQNISLVNIQKLAVTLGVSLADLFSPFTECPAASS